MRTESVHFLPSTGATGAAIGPVDAPCAWYSWGKCWGLAPCGSWQQDLAWQKCTAAERGSVALFLTEARTRLIYYLP